MSFFKITALHQATAPATPPRFRSEQRRNAVRGAGWPLVLIALTLSGCTEADFDRVGSDTIAVTCRPGLTPVAVISGNVALVSCAKESP